MSAMKSNRRNFLLGAASSVGAALVSAASSSRGAASSIQPVSCALVMAVDVSSSIDGEHWWLQRKGYADAFQQPEVIRAVTDTSRGRIAVTYFEWAGAQSQRVIIPWTTVATEDEGDDIAETLLRGARPFEGSTAVGSALDFAMMQLQLCPFTADQQVIDVSGDGGNNDGPSPEGSRGRAGDANIRINGLPIDWARSHPPSGMTIEDYYRASVIGGPNAFAMPAAGFDAFGYALAAKLRTEVS
jgi:hypothetical protein